MTLTFLGTRGEIEARTRRHRKHSSLLISGEGRSIMVDCGLDWLNAVKRLRPDAIFLTHAHADHAAGLRNGAPCEVIATSETWQRLSRYPVGHRRAISP